MHIIPNLVTKGTNGSLQAAVHGFNVLRRILVILSSYGLFVDDTVLSILGAREIVDSELTRSYDVGE